MNNKKDQKVKFENEKKPKIEISVTLVGFRQDELLSSKITQIRNIIDNNIKSDDEYDLVDIISAKNIK